MKNEQEFGMRYPNLDWRGTFAGVCISLQQVVLFHPISESIAADLEELCCARLIELRFLQRLEERLLLEFNERQVGRVTAG